MGDIALGTTHPGKQALPPELFFHLVGQGRAPTAWVKSGEWPCLDGAGELPFLEALGAGDRPGGPAPGRQQLIQKPYQLKHIGQHSPHRGQSYQQNVWLGDGQQPAVTLGGGAAMTPVKEARPSMSRGVPYRNSHLGLSGISVTCVHNLPSPSCPTKGPFPLGHLLAGRREPCLPCSPVPAIPE